MIKSNGGTKMGKFLPKIVKTVILNLGLTVEEFANQTKIRIEEIQSLFQKNTQWEIGNLQKFIDFCKENNQKNYSFDYLLTDNNGKLTEKDFDVDRFTIGQNGPNKLLFLKKINSYYHKFIDEYNLSKDFKKTKIIIYNNDRINLLLDDPYIRDNKGNPISEKPDVKNNQSNYVPNFDLIYKNNSLLNGSGSYKIGDYSLEVNYENIEFSVSIKEVLFHFKKGNLSLLKPLKKLKLKIPSNSFIHYLYDQKEKLFKKISNSTFENTMDIESKFLDYFNVFSSKGLADLNKLENKFKVFINHQKSIEENTRFSLSLLSDLGVTDLEVYSYWIEKIKEIDSKFVELNKYLLYLLSFFENPEINENNYLDENQYWFVGMGLMDYKKTFFFLNKNYKLIHLLLEAGAYIPLVDVNNSKQSKINFLKTDQLKDFLKKNI